MFSSPFNYSLLKKAQEKNLLSIFLHNIRDWAEDKHRMTDDMPYGGGCGMVMKIEPIDKALAEIKIPQDHPKVILMTPQGELLTHQVASELSREKQIIIICGRYEGVDERIRENLVNREISIGDYILTGGELAAMVLVDVVSRFIPDVLGNPESIEHESFAEGLLEYPQYTRPAIYNNWAVPEVLLSGNHAQIEQWKRFESLKRTYRRRPDLLKKAALSDEDIKLLEKIKQNDI
jgi:tRNA (guanine37-N1)-methyltransferase